MSIFSGVTTLSKQRKEDNRRFKNKKEKNPLKFISFANTGIMCPVYREEIEGDDLIIYEKDNKERWIKKFGLIFNKDNFTVSSKFFALSVRDIKYFHRHNLSEYVSLLNRDDNYFPKTEFLGMDKSSFYPSSDSIYNLPAIDIMLRQELITPWEKQLDDLGNSSYDYTWRIYQGVGLMKMPFVVAVTKRYHQHISKKYAGTVEDRLSKKLFSMFGGGFHMIMRNLIKDVPREKLLWMLEDANTWMIHCFVEFGADYENNEHLNEALGGAVLRRTLSNVPRGISTSVVSAIVNFHTTVGLTRTLPRSKKVWVFVYTLNDRLVKYGGRDGLEKATFIYEAFLRTEDPENIFNKHAKNNNFGRVPRKLSAMIRTWSNVFDIGEVDLAERRNITLAGISNLSIEYHEQIRREVPVSTYQSIDEETELGKPTFELPDIPGLTLLKTVGEVLEEGKKMHHCIGSYARGAINGGFHILHYENEDGDRATIQMGSDKLVMQVHGPHNDANKATSEIWKKLKEWSGDSRKSVEAYNAEILF